MCLAAQSCLTLCDPIDYSPPDFSVHGISQARILEWVAILFSRGSSQPRDRTEVSCIAGRFFIAWTTREAYALGISSEKTIIEKDSCTSVFIAALFTIARTHKQPRCPPTNDWIKKMWYVYAMEYYSTKKKNEFESSIKMDEPRACYTEWSKSEREKQI